MSDQICKKSKKTTKTKNLSRGGETKTDQQEKGRTDWPESLSQGRKMEPDQQKEGKTEWDASASSIEAEEGKEVGRRELEPKLGAEDETEAADRRPEDGGKARAGNKEEQQAKPAN